MKAYPWTPEEDRQLCAMAERGTAWQVVAKALERRTASACASRFHQIGMKATRAELAAERTKERLVAATLASVTAWREPDEQELAEQCERHRQAYVDGAEAELLKRGWTKAQIAQAVRRAA